MLYWIILEILVPDTFTHLHRQCSNVLLVIDTMFPDELTIELDDEEDENDESEILINFVGEV